MTNVFIENNLKTKHKLHIIKLQTMSQVNEIG